MAVWRGIIIAIFAAPIAGGNFGLVIARDSVRVHPRFALRLCLNLSAATG